MVTATLIEADTLLVEGGVGSIIHTLLVEGAQLGGQRVLLAQLVVARLREGRVVTSVARSSI